MLLKQAIKSIMLLPQTQAQAQYTTPEVSGKVLSFAKLFIEKVLKAEGEIDFETRLELENAVRNIEDNDILFQWQRFVESETEEDAQVEVKNLLELLIDKIKLS